MRGTLTRRVKKLENMARSNGKATLVLAVAPSRAEPGGEYALVNWAKGRTLATARGRDLEQWTGRAAMVMGRGLLKVEPVNS